MIPSSSSSTPSLLSKIAQQLSTSTPHLPLPPMSPPTETKNELEAFFSITVDEASLISQILNFLHLWTSDLSLYELLGLDLCNQFKECESFIGTDNSKEIKVSFQTKWYKLLQDKDKNPQELIAFLKNLTADLIWFSDALNKTKVPLLTDTLTLSSFHERRKSECREIIKIFRPKTILFIKLLEEGSENKHLFQMPLNKVIKIDENALAVDHANNNFFFKNMDLFTKFIFECVTIEDPSLLKDCSQFLEEVSSKINSFLSGLKLDRNAGEKLLKSNLSLITQLGTRAIYFKDVLLRVETCCIAYLNILLHRNEVHKQPQSLLHFLSGNITKPLSAMNQAASDDILISFKHSGLIDPSFVLSKEEEGLLNSLFEKYPLDSNLTMLDLLSFALFERIGALEKVVPLAKHPDLIKIRNNVGAYACCLFFGFTRISPDNVALLGPATTKDAEQFHLSPDKFIEYLQGAIQQLENDLIPPPRSQKSASLSEKSKLQLKKQIENTLLPIQRLWVKLLKCKNCSPLILNSLSFYKGAEKLDEENPRGFEVFLNFLNFHQLVSQHALRASFFQSHHHLERLPKLTKRSNRKDFERFVQSIADMFVELLSTSKGRSKIFLDALAGRVTQESLNNAQGTRIVSKKSQVSFIESIHADIASIAFSLGVIGDVLRLAEKRALSKELLSTRSSFLRFIHNFNSLYFKKKIKVREFPLIEKILFPLIDYFKSDSFHAIYSYIHEDNPVLLHEIFDHPHWLKMLKPLENELECHLNTTLKSLKCLPAEFKEHLYTLPLAELQEMKAEEIRESFFQGGVQLLQPIQILMDCLTILQKRRFYEEAAIIPAELANIMDLDGVEELLQEVIQSKKSPQIPHQTDELKVVSNVEVEVMPVVIEEIAAPVKVPVKKRNAQKTKPPLREPVKKTVVSEPVNEDYEEIVDLTKSRKILKKLEEMGYVTARTKGSHFILKNVEGNTVVVPKNDDLPIGTRQSIALQAFQNSKET